MVNDTEYKEQVKELAQNIHKLKTEVHHLRNEKIIVQQHLNNLVQDIEKLHLELYQSLKTGNHINLEAKNLVSPKEFPDLVISHNEKLLIREKLRQMIQKIEFELQRF